MVAAMTEQENRNMIMDLRERITRLETLLEGQEYETEDLKKVIRFHETERIEAVKAINTKIETLKINYVQLRTQIWTAAGLVTFIVSVVITLLQFFGKGWFE